MLSKTPPATMSSAKKIHKNPSTEESIQSSRKYIVDNINDLTKITEEAAKVGDNLMLKFLLDPLPLSPEELKITIELDSIKQEEERLLRKSRILSTQSEVMTDHFRNWGRVILSQNYDTEMLETYFEDSYHFRNCDSEKLKPFQGSLYRFFIACKSLLDDKNDFDTPLELLALLLDGLVTYCKVFHSDVQDHLEDINIAVSCRLDSLLTKFRLEHQKMLNQQTEVLLDGKIVGLTTRLRVKLHKEFSLKLIDEFNSLRCKLDSSSFRGCLVTDQEFAKLKNSLTEELIGLDNQKEKLITRLKELKSKRRIRLSNLRAERESAFQTICETKTFTSSKNELELIGKLLRYQIKASYRNRSTGNNLIHFAARQGKFDTAIFLAARGVDLLTKNDSNIAAIDTQDMSGDTLIHYLTRQGRFEEVISCIKKGASVGILNYQKQHVLDFFYNGNTLFHFLLENIYKSEHLRILIKLIESYPKLSLLLHCNSKEEIAYKIILNLTAGPRNQILLSFYNANINLPYFSGFSGSLNLALWGHFKTFVDRNANIAARFFGKIIFRDDRNEIVFLQKLQQLLLEGNRRRCDADVLTYLHSQMRFINELPKTLRDDYSLPLQHVQLIRQSARRRELTAEESQYFLHDDNLSARSSSYSTLEKKIKLSNGDQSQNVTLDRGDTVHYSEPLQNNAKKRRDPQEIIGEIQEKCPDPCRWFSPK